MPAGAQIQFTQGGNVGIPGRALVGVVGTTVAATNAEDDPSIVRSVWTLVGCPSRSALVPGVAQDGASATWDFDPDSKGDYEVLLECYTSTAPGSPVVYSDQRMFRVLLKSGRSVPAFGGSGGPLPGHNGVIGSQNVNGDTRGWSPDQETWLLLLNVLAFNWITTAVDLAIDPEDTAVKVNSPAHTRTITLPDATEDFPGQHWIMDVGGKAGTFPITIATTAGQTIDGQATLLLQADRGIARVVSDGANWVVLYCSPNRSPVRLDHTLTSGQLQLTNDMAGRTIYCDTITGGGLAGPIKLPTTPYPGMRLPFKDPKNNGWSTTPPTFEDLTPRLIEDGIALGTWPADTYVPDVASGGQSFILEYDDVNNRWNQVSGG